MTPNEYQRLAMTTLNSSLEKKDILINGVMGLCGEAGEAIDIVKKHLAQGNELDREHLIKELGDIAWYLAETATALDVSLEYQEAEEKISRRFFCTGFKGKGQGRFVTGSADFYQEIKDEKLSERVPVVFPLRIKLCVVPHAPQSVLPWLRRRGGEPVLRHIPLRQGTRLPGILFPVQ